MKKISALWLLLIIVIGFYGCDLGDKEKVDSETVRKKVNPGYLDEKTGLRIASFNSDECDVVVYYADNGKIDYITDGDGCCHYVFDADNNKISYNRKGDTYQSDGSYMLGYDVSGFLTSVSYSIQSKEEKETYTSNDTERGGISFSYDSKSHLTHMEFSERDNWTTKRVDGSSNSGSESYTISIDFYWTGDLITRMNVHTKVLGEKEGDNKCNLSFVYENPNYKNKYGQISSFTSLFLWDQLDMFTCLGWLGVGPVMLPSGCSSEWERTYKGKTEKGKGSGIFNYEFTGDGAVSRCFVGDDEDSYCDFTYDYGVIGK